MTNETSPPAALQSELPVSNSDFNQAVPEASSEQQAANKPSLFRVWFWRLVPWVAVTVLVILLTQETSNYHLMEMDRDQAASTVREMHRQQLALKHQRDELQQKTTQLERALAQERNR